MKTETTVYDYHIALNTDAYLTEIAKETLQDIQSNSPVKTGEYKSGWKMERLNANAYLIYNAKKPTLTHLLENGHIKTGAKGKKKGRVKPHPHIRPAFNRMQDRIYKCVGKIKIETK